VSLLLKGQGHLPVGVDLSPRMVERARHKISMAGVEFLLLVGDASDPPAEAGDAFDVVLTRHLLWTLPDPAGALSRWIRLLRPGGRLVLIEGRWDVPAGAAPYVAGARRLPWNGGVTAEDLAAAVRPLVGELWSEPLDDPVLWGRAIHDERYALIAQV
jgi:SAM-dependent methyltransferase